MKKCKQLLLLASSLISIGLAQAQSNTPPVGFSQSLISTQGSSLFIALTASDADGDPLTYRIATPPYLGYLTGAPPNVLYVSTTNFSATVTDSFTFVANDGLTDSAPATISIALFPQTSDSNTLPVLSLVSNDAVASEALNPDGTTNTATFSIQRTGNVSNDVSVSLLVHGSATYGSDYYTIPALLGLFSNSTTTVFIPAGATSIVYTLYPIPDNLAESTEFAIFTINTNSSYALGLPSQITVSILDSNPPPVPGTRITFPPEGSVYASTLDIKVRISNTNLTDLKLYSNDQLLASFTPTPPVALVSPTVTFVTNFSVGPHTLYSVGNDSATSAPVHFEVLAPLNSNPLSPSLGIAPEANASFVIDSNGALFDCGDGRFGALGDGSVPNQEPNIVARPVQIPLPDGTNRFVKVSSGARHTLALTADGSVWSSGANIFGLGTNSGTFRRSLITPDFPGAKDIAAGNFHSLALDTSGHLYSWGTNTSGQLGIGTNSFNSMPQLVAFPAGVTAFTAIAAGSNYSIALGDNGQLYSCGLGIFGTLGTGGQTNSPLLVHVTVPTGVTNWQKVTAGAQHVLAIADSGAIFSWGLGSSGQLGNGNFTSSPVPRLATLLLGVTNWVALSAGASHSLGLASDGNIYVWGTGFFGQLGPGALTRTIPTLMPPPPGVASWKTMGSGINHSLGIGDNCTLYAWGANNFGQLGIGSTTNQTNEVAVSNLGDLCAPPVVTITLPIDGSVFAASANILINAEATRHDGQISRIDLFENGILLASGTNTPFSFIWSTVVQGTYTLTAAAADNINPTSFSTSAPVNITVSSSNSTLPVVSVLATDAQAAEPPPTNNGTFTFTRTGNTQLPLTILFRISGTATLNTDYQTSPPLATGTNTTIYFRTIPANSNSATLAIIPLADTNIEQTETVVLTLFTNSAYTLGNQNGAIVTILNSTNSPPPPPPPILNLVTTDSQAYELTASGGIDTASFMVTRTGGSNFVRFPITVSGTATYGVDYYTVPAFALSSNSSAAIFELQTNQNSLQFTLYPIQDNLAEGTETAVFRLGTNAGYTIGLSNQSVISISDGPLSPQLAGVLFPPNGAVFASPESINIKAEATNALELRIYADDQLLAISNPPSAATFMLSASTNFSPGEHTVYAVGTNRVGLVANTFTSAPVHFQVLAPLARPTAPSIGVAPNANASYVIDANGALFDWGLEAYGALADGVSSGSFVLLPQQIPLGDGTNRWTKVASGGYHTLALDSSGTLYSAGKDDFGQLGRPNALNEGFLPVAFPTNVSAWGDIAAGSVHSLGLTPDGRLFAWGFDTSGQLGFRRTTNSVIVPTPVPFPAGVSAWNAIAAGQYFSVALANDGNLYTCGSIDGSSSDGNTNASTFLPVPLPANVTNWLKVVAGPKHILAVAGSGALYAWGVGESGQLGNGDFTNSPTPVRVSSPTNVFNWIALGAGFSHSLGLASDGNLYSWGSDVYGELGPGAVPRAVPGLVPPPAGVVSWTTVSAGLAHSLAIGANCTLYTWGQNLFGQLGVGSFVNQTNETPVQNLNTLCAAFTNQPPIALSQFLVATQRTIVPITLTASDPDNDPLTYRIVMPPSLGYLTGAPPNVLYISTTNFLTTVTDRFTFVANDGHTDSFPATVTLLLFPPGQSSNTLPIVTITSTDSVASEFLNSDGTTNSANFTIRRTAPTNDSLHVLLSVAGTANYGLDYYTIPPLNVSSNSQTITVPMPPGAASIPFTLYGNGHYLPNSSVFAIFAIGTNGGYSLGAPNQLTLLIINSNQPPINNTRVFFPPDGAIFASPDNIELRVANTNVQVLKLYADNHLLATASQFGTFIFNYVTNFAPGPHTAYSVRDNIVTSAPVHFFVIATNALNPNSPSLGVTPTANSSFVVDANGALFDWGYDGFANLGDGGVSNTFFSAGVTLPIQIPLPASGAAWAKVSAGGYHALSLDNLGNVYAAGDNSAGQIGVGRSSTTFIKVVLNPTHFVRCKDVAAGNYHSLALTTDGQIYAWGHNDFGELGIGSTTNAPFPQLVSFPPGVSNWTAIAAGTYHSLALGNDENAYAWGEGSFGLLGNGGFTNSARPQRVILPASVTNWVKIASGGYHNLALAGNGRLYAWGAGGSGELGYGGTADSSVPVAVNAPSNVVNWTAISAGIIHSIALAEDGSLYGWGDNLRGQLGPNASLVQPTPFLITPPSGVQSWQQISAGAFHNLAIADSCRLYSWGSNSLGQLGVGSFVQRTNLQLVHNLDDLCIGTVTETNHAPSFVKGPDVTVPENAGIQVFTNWATQINPGAPTETNQTLTFIVTNDNPHLFSTQPGIVPSGNLFFAGAPNSNGIAHVTIVLKDNGGTANGGQDTSAPQSFVITIMPPNHPPVPVVRVFPSFMLSSNYCAFQVISPNGSNAVVYFDASLSSDVDGDPLTFAWFDNGTNHLFGSTVVATNVLAIGTNSLTLAVSDGHVTVFDPFEVDVISAGNAVGELIDLLWRLASSHPGTKPNTWKQLIDSLQEAQSEFEKGSWNAGLVHVRIFEFRVLTQIEPIDPGLANNLIYIAQQIIGAVQGNTRQQPTIHSLQNGGGHKSLSFTGVGGQIYLVQASSDLTHWETIGAASETDPGNFQFDDTNCSSTSARFYRLVVP